MERNLAVLEKQEELLTFEHFTNEDAWELGCFMVEEAKKRDLHISIAIRHLSGYTWFQYGFAGTGWINENWMRRKFNTVKDLGRSSLRSALFLENIGESLELNGLDLKNHVLAGGGFPVRIKGSDICGAVLVSGMYHYSDHQFIVDCLSAFLKVRDVPALSYVSPW